MGLQSQLSDVSSESLIVLAAVLLGKGVSYLHSLLFTILHAFGLFSTPSEPDCYNSSHDVVGSGLAGIILLCDHLNVNRAYSHPGKGGDRFGSDCVVCLNRLVEGDPVRRLPCCHVFHRECLDGWLQHLSFSCPICRAPLVSDERVDFTRKTVAEDLFAWFPFQY